MKEVNTDILDALLHSIGKYWKYNEVERRFLHVLVPKSEYNNIANGHN